MSAALPCGSSNTLPGLMRHPGAPVTDWPMCPLPLPLPWEDLKKRLNLQIFQACLHRHFSRQLAHCLLKCLFEALALQPPGWEFMRSVCRIEKLVRDGFACLASEHLKKQKGRAGGAEKLESWPSRARRARTTVIGLVLAPSHCWWKPRSSCGSVLEVPHDLVKCVGSESQALFFHSLAL